MSKMNHISGTAKRKKRRLRWRKEFVFICALMMLVVGTLGTTLAYLVDSTEDVVNTFTYVSPGNTIEENFEDNVKKDVTVKNTGTASAYIRAAIVITWKNESGEVYGALPVKDTDYSITLGSRWILGGDGYYYYPAPVEAGQSTANLIDECQPMATEPDGYTLNVEILSESIQSTPTTAVTESWGVTLGSDGNITGKN